MADLLPPAQSRMGAVEGREFAKAAIKGMAGVKIILSRAGVTADQAIVIINRNFAFKHIFAGILIMAIAGETLFIARIDHRRPAREKHQA